MAAAIERRDIAAWAQTHAPHPVDPDIPGLL